MSRRIINQSTGVVTTDAGFVKPDFSGLLAPVDLDAARSGATLSRGEFFAAVWQAGIVSKAEAKASSGGDIPTTLQTAIDAAVLAATITQAQADEIEIRWPSYVIFERNHMLIDIAQVAYGLTDAQVDGLFGIT